MNQTSQTTRASSEGSKTGESTGGASSSAAMSIPAPQGGLNLDQEKMEAHANGECPALEAKERDGKRYVYCPVCRINTWQADGENAADFKKRADQEIERVHRRFRTKKR